ncbi:PREDICTED: major royal jelly protein 2 [Nicrophorus vespilloides]|uniref:Major royal jelly protein 2 n=1 Tax=Nicrophorus vespilloides TaxID=110193 RepID=A0ABM1MW20_NICVS|nr:PREDICTED: major royal jelly protein 2 [Nicrophorus vespilloides]
MAFRFLCLAALMAVAAAQCDRLIPDLSYKLNGINMNFPCESTKSIYISSGRYVPKNVIATRMQIYKEDAIVALPRYKHGVPFTLAKFSLRTKGCQASLTPFPCWPMQEEGNCDALQSVVDIFLDQMDILWALDVGIVNTLEQPVRRCPPKVVGINMKTGQVIKVIDLSTLISANSRLQYLVVDYASDGKAYVYVADAGAATLVVYDVFDNKGYRVVLPPACANTQKDVLYLALVRKSCGNALYFSYLSSPKMYSIKSINLQNGQAAGAIVEVGAKQEGVKTVMLGSDNGAGIFFRYKGESDVYIWNSESCYKPENFVIVQKGNECRLPTQVVPGYKRLMWAIESNFHDYIANTAGCLGANMVVHPLIKTCDE